MDGTSELRNNVDAGAAESILQRVENEGDAAQVYATLALAYEQRTTAMVEAGRLQMDMGNTVEAQKLLTAALGRMGR